MNQDCENNNLLKSLTKDYLREAICDMRVGQVIFTKLPKGYYLEKEEFLQYMKNPNLDKESPLYRSIPLFDQIIKRSDSIYEKLFKFYEDLFSQKLGQAIKLPNLPNNASAIFNDKKTNVEKMRSLNFGLHINDDADLLLKYDETVTMPNYYFPHSSNDPYIFNPLNNYRVQTVQGTVLAVDLMKVKRSQEAFNKSNATNLIEININVYGFHSLCF